MKTNFHPKSSTFHEEGMTEQILRARLHWKKGQYEEAITLLKEVLLVKASQVNIPPFISIIDIVALHLEIGCLSSFFCDNDYKEAHDHFYWAWTLCQKHYGDRHPFTKDAREKFLSFHRCASLHISAAAAA